MQITVQQIADCLNTQPVLPPADAERLLTHITWDSRQVQPGGVFLAIVGEQTDGNDYLSEALNQGAALLIASRPVTAELKQQARTVGAAIIEVCDPEWAIGQIAAFWRQQLPARVIGVTGSSGKTSTKELVAAVLSRRYKTAKNPGNYNNLLGLPATILSCDVTSEILVLEMGMQCIGEIARYSEISRPEMAVYTNIGTAHIELLGSQQAILEAKSELLAALPPSGGPVIVNGDDPFTEALLREGLAAERDIEVIRYGFAATNQVYADHIEYDSRGMASFTLHLPDDSCTIRLGIAGEHSIKNALAAAAIGYRLGVATDDIRQALQTASAVEHRQQRIELASGATIIDDSYNANPDSMRAALVTLAHMDKTRPHIAVLGDMLELGPDEDELHRGIGSVVAETNLSHLLTVGSRARHIAAAAREHGFDGSIDRLTEYSEAVEILSSTIADSAANPDGQPIILVKASHSIALDRIVDALVELDGAESGPADGSGPADMSNKAGDNR